MWDMLISKPNDRTVHPYFENGTPVYWNANKAKNLNKEPHIKTLYALEPTVFKNNFHQVHDNVIWIGTMALNTYD